MTRRSRRRFLLEGAAATVAAGLGAAAMPWGALRRRVEGSPRIEGGFVGQAFERGHRLRESSFSAPDQGRRAKVVIVGAGIAGLSAARALAQAGVDDLHLFELEDETGGNSRGGVVGGFPCPWGAHYLPVPGPAGEDAAELLEALGVRRVVDGEAHYDELTLCLSPQERLFIGGHWQDGLLPVDGQGAAVLEQYRRFSARVRELTSMPGAFAIPTAASRWSPDLSALDAQTFARWLDTEGFDAPPLRWYLDYACRDDYGAGSGACSAWAGIHYFAARNGFAAPPEIEAGEEVLTWPEGNAWLARRLAAPFASRTRCGAIVRRVVPGANDVAVDVLDATCGRVERWTCDHAILAVPLFVAARLVASPPPALVEAAARVPHAPWLVANLHLDAPLEVRRGDAPLAWDNVLYGVPGLGYVDARHQELRSVEAGPTVITYYRSFGDDPVAGRAGLLATTWEAQCETILRELGTAHPDLRDRTRRIEIMRYGHAMAIPAPGVRGSAALAALAEPQAGRLAFAHADLSGYSVFEEAYHHGLRAGRDVAAKLVGLPPRR